MTKNKKILIGSIVILFALFVLYILQSTNDFKSALSTYSRLAKTQTDAAYVPGAPDNPVRQRLNSVLSQVLARPMSSSERLALAQEGLSTLKEAETQIDDIGVAGERVQNAILYMEEKNNALGALSTRSKGANIIALAKEEASIIADIRGLSYRANFHTAEIFNRIVLDRGELTAAYTDELNSQIPAVEEQFNKRTALYEQLKSIAARIQKATATL